ncbi:putative M75-family peptidase [Actinoplanes missouriensis 431]|uniref:Putative M75-family peptidase n=1 Tax=Actinoplanes missouriensis (strain ATCC 14538 / DSM 43046 / CBS 188.64 / JCM 3121 / NBRC 102363 / NCIMB 12654 / NRRL B-3342 / UNCC 431) TaxID=512565 RepID=I0H9H3_ACTM4|nr:iron uptake system protein EfeO [Actinoplanes missouriensis]BAL89660.1 putative M75-family peptidase [Actinoplanes missouriensis 431]
MRRLTAASAATLLLLAGCGSSTDDAGGAAGDGSIAVAASDTTCDVAKAESAAGTVTFAIANKGNKVTEFYVYAPGDRVMGEVENIAPGLSRELHVELAAGTYETACKPGMVGKGIRNGFTVTGSSAPLTEDAKLAQATKDYQRYVKSQTAALIEKTTEFVTAVKAGDAAKAKALFPVSRTYWERIEPVAEIFGDLDPAIDGREDGLEPGQDFTGYHRIEKDLWQTKDISKSGPIADKLLVDVQKIVDQANSAALSPLQLANGAKELLDEVATGKITGEEDRYSHTDLWDFAANVEGSQAAIAALRPALEEKDPALVKTLDEKFAAVEASLEKHRAGDGWKLHNQLTEADLKVLSDHINALAEPISKVAALVAGK